MCLKGVTCDYWSISLLNHSIRGRWCCSLVIRWAVVIECCHLATIPKLMQYTYRCAGQTGSIYSTYQCKADWQGITCTYQCGAQTGEGIQCIYSCAAHEDRMPQLVGSIGCVNTIHLSVLKVRLRKRNNVQLRLWGFNIPISVEDQELKGYNTPISVES